MTEGQNLPHIDIFLRQGLIGGNRVPVLWGGNFDLLKMLHEHADADVGEVSFVDLEQRDKPEFVKSYVEHLTKLSLVTFYYIYSLDWELT